MKEQDLKTWNRKILLPQTHGIFDHRIRIKLMNLKLNTKKSAAIKKIDYVPIFTDQNFDVALSEYIRKRQKVY